MTAEQKILSILDTMTPDEGAALLSRIRDELVRSLTREPFGEPQAASDPSCAE